MQNPQKPKIVIHVSGGLVQDVYSDKADIEVIVVDEDNIHDGGDPPATDLKFKDGTSAQDLMDADYVQILA